MWPRGVPKKEKDSKVHNPPWILGEGVRCLPSPIILFCQYVPRLLSLKREGMIAADINRNKDNQKSSVPILGFYTLYKVPRLIPTQSPE